MKTPISYYGGKQNLISELIPLIPKHVQYVEPFCGGASLFWSKKPSQHEVINDYDLRIFNFWEVLQTDFEILQKKIKSTLHSEAIYYKAKDILKSEMTDRVEFAWAFWVQTQMSFGTKIYGGFAFNSIGQNSLSRATKKDNFDDRLFLRLRGVEIFNRDAIELIKMKDSKDTFFYFDPPYAESECGHYAKLKEVYYRLLALLPTLKGQWLMSSYPSEQLTEIRALNGFNFKDIQQSLSVSGKHNAGKTKTECLTWNYELQGKMYALFEN
jgi:DNA adenine methylase